MAVYFLKAKSSLDKDRIPKTFFSKSKLFCFFSLAPFLLCVSYSSKLQISIDYKSPSDHKYTCPMNSLSEPFANAFRCLSTLAYNYIQGIDVSFAEHIVQQWEMSLIVSWVDVVYKQETEDTQLGMTVFIINNGIYFFQICFFGFVPGSLPTFQDNPCLH